MKYNYHTHTKRCFHAKGEDEEYVLAAIKAGFGEIGFADHSPWNFEGGFVSRMRMSADELGEYAQSIKHLREKYKDKISIKLGLECEYFPQYLSWLREMIEKHGIDYLILGHHFCGDEINDVYNGFISTPEEIYNYRDDVLAAMESGLFAYVAHPDLYMRGYPVFDEHCEKVAVDIISKSIATNTPLEYNLLGFKHGINDKKPGYPHPKFWEIAADMKPLCIVGIDAHYPEAYFESDLFEAGYENLKKLGLKTVDRIEFFR